MSPDEFILSNIIKKLTDSGYQGGGFGISR